jgi:RHS repeat-associated protein
MVDTAGNVVNNYSYDEWGNILAKTEAVDNPFKYAGEIYDDETGLYYLRARYYDPQTGRFINEDSYEGQVTDPLSLNLYTYCENDPIDKVDPSGNRPIVDNDKHGRPIVENSNGSVISLFGKGTGNGTTNQDPLSWLANGKSFDEVMDEINCETMGWGEFVTIPAKLIVKGAEAGPKVGSAIEKAGKEILKLGKNIAKLFKGKEAARTVNALNLPANINNAGKFVSWARQFEKAKIPLSKAQAEELVTQAKKFGVKVEATASDLTGHVGKAGESWGIPHIHIGKARVHIPVPKGFKID